MILETVMLKLANEAIAHAPNENWKNRGGVVLVGDLKLTPVKTWGDQNPLGIATVGYFQFQKEDQREKVNVTDNRFAFIGFTLAAIKSQGKLIYETQPIIGKIQEKSYHSNGLASRFCPQCHSIDTVKRSSRKMGPECALITYKCKCGYHDEDVMD